MTSTRFRRNIFSGQIEEIRDDPQAEFDELNARARERVAWQAQKNSRQANPYYKDQPSRAMSLKPEEATPERIAKLNEDAKRNGTGAYYTKDGTCYTPTRRSKAKEGYYRGQCGVLPGFMDLDGGYSDYCGR